MKAITKLLLLAVLVVCMGAAKGQMPELRNPKPLLLYKDSHVEFANPLLSDDGSKLFFVTSFDDFNVGGRLAGQDIWQVNRDSQGEEWKSPVNVTRLNNHENNGVVGIGAGDSVLYLLNTYSNRNRWKHALAISNLTEDHTWSNPTEVKLKFPFLDDFRNLYASSNGQVIVVSGVYERENKEDLYVYYQDENEWIGPVNLTSINTPNSEISPFYYEPRNALFFASNRPGGFGDYDIYVSYRQGNWDEWSAPMHLDQSVNSESFDAYLSTYENGESFYVSSKNETSEVLHGIMDWIEIVEEDTVEEVPLEPIIEDTVLVVEEYAEEPIIEKEEPEEPETPVVMYAVQIIAMPRGQDPGEGYFDNLNSTQIEMSPGKDRLDRYYLGIYDTLPDAKKAMKLIRQKGYEDAFVRPLSVYTTL